MRKQQTETRRRPDGRKSRWPWLTVEQMPDRMLACFVGLPPMCWHKICRRHGRCVAKDFSCLDDHLGYVRRWADKESRGEEGECLDDSEEGEAFEDDWTDDDIEED